jgi:hypothetical protein
MQVETSRHSIILETEHITPREDTTEVAAGQRGRGGSIWTSRHLL